MAENTLSFVKLDYSQHQAALLQRIRSRWSLSWNDFLANNFGRILVDLIAWSVSVMAFILNRAAAENFLSTMTLRESAVRIGSLVSYKLRNPVAATVMCEAVVAGAPVASLVKLAKGTAINVITGSSTIPFELADDYTVAIGTNTPETVVLVVDPFAAGDDVLNTTFIAVAGNENLDLSDSTIDLTQYLSTGQYLLRNGASDNQAHRIIDIISSPSSTQKNRLVISPPWGTDVAAGEPDGTFSVTITERRVSFVQGQTFAETFAVPSVDTPGFTIKLSRTPVIDDSVVVNVDGTVWPVVSTLSLEDSGAQVVEIKILPDGTSTIVFGDGVFGAIPANNAAVIVTYRIGGGIVGNVDVGTINATVIGQQTGGQVTVAITNSWSPGIGGADLESLAEARNNIPPFIRANDQGVTLEDYASLASRFSDVIQGQVKFARAASNVINSLLEGNVVTIYAWTTGPTGGLIPLSVGLKNALTSYLRTKAVGTDLVVVLDGTTRPAPIAVRFKVFSGFSITTVATAIASTIQGIIAGNKPGDPIIFSDMVRKLDEVSGVSALTVATPLNDLTTVSSIEIFTAPNDSFVYNVDLTLVDSHTYTGQLPVSPLAPWCFTVNVNNSNLLIVPDNKPGFARLIGDSSINGTANYDVGLKKDRPITLTANMASDFFFATDEQILYRADVVAGSPITNPTLNWKAVSTGGSYVDLNTGKIVISFKGDPRTVTLSLVTAQGYDTERTVNLFIGYSGDNSLVKRREIRSALRIWANGFKIGGTLFTSAIRGADGSVLLATSRSNINDVVLSVSGVTGVNRINLDSPSNSAVRLDTAGTELLKIGSITLNGNVD
jgi:hypothetical protein